jgi:hypothetical protein
VPIGLKVTKGASHVVTQSASGSFDVYTFTAGNDNITIG